DVVLGEHGDLIHQTLYTQPALFAIETALFRLLENLGLKPDFLAGHSIGELTAAHCAGILTLPDAAALVAARARLMHTLPTGGAMLTTTATETDVRDFLPPNVDIAAVNSPTNTVLSGPADTIDTLAKDLTSRGHKARTLTVSHAFHSALMDPILDDFHAIAATLTFQTPHTPIASALTATLDNPDHTTHDYWTRHIRGTVRFADTLTTLHQAGTTTYLELGPDTTLTTLTAQTLPQGTHTIPTLRPNTDDT
ncbi:acyltransferase domain-containing protein, partial [Streptomyces viridochromogenes]